MNLDDYQEMIYLKRSYIEPKSEDSFPYGAMDFTFELCYIHKDKKHIQLNGKNLIFSDLNTLYNTKKFNKDKDFLDNFKKFSFIIYSNNKATINIDQEIQIFNKDDNYYLMIFHGNMPEYIQCNKQDLLDLLGV